MLSAERRALFLLLGLAVAGHLLLAWTGRPADSGAPGDVRLLGPAGGSNLAAHRDSAALAGRPLAAGERIDLDRAGAAELVRLPRIGPGLARRIVEERAAHGPFGSLDGLRRVQGVGDGLLKAIESHASFSAAGQFPVPVPPVSPVSGPGPISPVEPTRGNPAPIDLNRASEAELERLPGVGPSLARRISEYRTRHGGFAAVDSLVRVAGIGPATLARLRGLVEVR
ncbi:MAG TPA: helix-hairpin-helix domain-containing protein [Gemmatimonadales bacterium]|nr:helix-hairpin-helix domain-containing protein [Gemmatimonadales bacterium]